MRIITEKIFQSIKPIISEADMQTGQTQYAAFKDNFIKNYELLRNKMRLAVFGEDDEGPLLDRHKVAAEVIISLLSTSRYKQDREAFSRFVSDSISRTSIRYKKYPNEMLAWQGGITILLNFFLEDIKKNNPEKESTVYNRIFNKTDSNILINDEILGCTSVTHASDEVQYIDTILMLLNQYNYYEQFNTVSVFSLAQILYLYEHKISKIFS